MALGLAIALLAQVEALPPSLEPAFRLHQLAVTATGEARIKAIRASNAEVARVVQEGKLGTATEYRRAARLLIPLEGDLVPVQMVHELSLVAAAMNDEESSRLLASSWDALRVATGRRQRFGTIRVPKELAGLDRWQPDPAPETLRRIHANPGRERTLRLRRADNRNLVKDRTALGTETDLAALIRRTRERVMRGEAQTSIDMLNAADILGDSTAFEEVSLAHELCLGAIWLGNRDALARAASTYDRALLIASYPQRFGTQRPFGTPEFLDSYGISEAMRRAVIGG
ncbi:MAG: hypothetical protein SFX74_09590 [Fimbriimonadaceae bacterium]|nr:hypothetical protein [Fimbriimonadaceae bacterium]